jgi:hypothetical protein
MALTLPDTAAPPTGACIVMRTRADLPAEDQATLDSWLADPAIAGWRIGRAIDVGTSSVNAHRATRCNCWGKI